MTVLERAASAEVVDDIVLPFAVESLSVRGRLVRLGPAIDLMLKRYQVNARLMARAKPDALFMHCMPVHRGEEATEDVIDGPQSVIFDEAENRLHAQKGVLAWCLGATL